MATTTVYRAISTQQFYTTSIAYSLRREFTGQPWLTSQMSLGSVYNQGGDDLRFVNRFGVHEDYVYGNYLVYDSNSRMFQLPPAFFSSHYSSITTTT